MDANAMSRAGPGLVREARLRPEWAHAYPDVPAGVWLPASELGAKMLLVHLRSSFAPALGTRLLDDRHFEFRGGIARGTTSPHRTRYLDETTDLHSN